LRRDILLRRALEIACRLGAPAHHLHGIHHIRLLIEVGIAEG
jgi:hypothetical protein